jgi:purine-binding chemotaxis protein CheW
MKKNAATTSGRELQLAVFRIGGKKFALDIMKINEIARYQVATPVPRMPDFLEGVINKRGKVIPIIDLRKRLEEDATSIPDSARIIIATVTEKIVGIIVDEVQEVIRVPWENITMPPDIIKSIGAEFLLGVCKWDDELILLLNFENLLTTTEKLKLGQVGHAD